jgi:hypothetical protein
MASTHEINSLKQFPILKTFIEDSEMQCDVCKDAMQDNGTGVKCSDSSEAPTQGFSASFHIDSPCMICGRAMGAS